MSAKKTKSLFFDGQVFQTPAWHRGMGKYSLELIIALNKLNKMTHSWDSISVILSDQLETEDTVYKAFNERAQEVEIIKLSLERNEYDNKPVAARNRKIIDEHFDSLTKGESTIDYMVLSLMQSEIAPAFSSLDYVHNYLLFYDLIPLMFFKTYLPDSLHQKSYLSKLAELLKADNYLAISKTVANDLTTILGIDSKRVMSIDGAPIKHGRNAERIDLPGPFILMPTGNDLRKNNRRGVEGFEIFNQKHGNKYSLLVTSVFQDFEIQELKMLSKNVIFTGNVSGEQLEYLYEKTDALLFPTEYEGLGLPILEALEKEKPVACSDISVFREISDSAFEYFDPKDVESISEALFKATDNKNLPFDEYKRVLNKFTWERTAELFKESSDTWQKNIGSKKKDLTVFAPSTDEVEYGSELQQLHSELVRISEPTYYMDTYGAKNKNSINYLVQCSKVLNIARPTNMHFSEATLPVYFVDDKADSAGVLLAALAKPGVLILKSSDLTALWDAAVERKMIHKSRLIVEQELEMKLNTNGLLSSLIANQKIVFVHDKTLKEKIDSTISSLGTSKVEVVSTPRPSSTLVYNELNQDFSILDYIVSPDKTDYTFKDFAEAVMKEAII